MTSAIGLCTLALVGVAHADRLTDLLRGMSIEDRVGQVLMVTTGGARVTPAVRRFLARVRPGGITLFRYHLRDPGRVRRLTRALAAAVRPVPPLIAVDHEGGPVVRIARGVPRLPPLAVFGAAADPALAERAGRLVGAALGRLGIHMNLAPVLDVPRRGGGRHLVRRAFGGDPRIAAILGAAYVRGLQAAGVAAVAKHFPGEGTSRGDPHRGRQRATAGPDELSAVDLEPFRHSGADAVMVGHVAYPRLDPLARPASLSPPIYALLRREVGFDGVALTDGLEMRAVRGRWRRGRAAVDALRAGADMVSIFAAPARILEARAAILRAVRSGALPRERLEEAVRRVLAVKLRRGLWGGPRPARIAEGPAALLADLGRRAARVVRGAAGPIDGSTPVLSSVAAVLRVAGRAAVDLRRTPRARAIAQAVRAGAAVVAGGTRAARLARRLERRGARVVLVAAVPPARARRLRATTVIAAWEKRLLAGAVSALLGARSSLSRAFTGSRSR